MVSSERNWLGVLANETFIFSVSPWGDAAAERCCLQGVQVTQVGDGSWTGRGTILLCGTLVRSQAEPWPLRNFRLLATGLISTLGHSLPVPSARHVFKVRGGVFTSSSVPFHVAWPVVGALWAYIEGKWQDVESLDQAGVSQQDDKFCPGWCEKLPSQGESSGKDAGLGVR